MKIGVLCVWHGNVGPYGRSLGLVISTLRLQLDGLSISINFPQIYSTLILFASNMWSQLQV